MMAERSFMARNVSEMGDVVSTVSAARMYQETSRVLAAA